MKAFYAGSFDPMTMGHLEIIERASRVFDTVVVAVMFNHEKRTLFSKETRIDHLKKATSHLTNVEIVVETGLTVDAAKRQGCTVLVRGLRNAQDLSYEMELEHYNKRLNHELETVYFASSNEMMYVSSSKVKELALFNASLNGLVPEVIKTEVEQALKPKTN